MMKIKEENFPYLIEFMQKHLFQEAADSMEEAILVYEQNGEECVNAVLRELDILRNSNVTEAELTEFVLKYSDYIIDDSGAKTLDFIRKVLEHEPHEMI